MKKSIKNLIGNSHYRQWTGIHHKFYYIPDTINPIMIIKVIFSFDKNEEYICCFYNNKIYEEKDFEKLSKLKIFW